jgi:hypothetical protein
MWSGPGAGWAQSRFVWNQHAYTPVAVRDDSKIPTTSALQTASAAAWTPANPRLNSFRQQLQYPGTPASGLPDMTVQYPCKENFLTLCNRGAGTAPPGVMVVGFPGNASGFEGSSDKNVTVGPCYTTTPIAPGACVEIACAGAGKGTEEYMVNPSCSGGTCKTNTDCKGGGATCNLSTGFCQAVCKKEPFIGATPPLPECTDNAGSWSFVHGGKSGACGGAFTPPSAATFVRDFQATCPSPDLRPVWTLFTYSTVTPAGTNVAFNFKTASTQAGLASAVAPAAALVAQPGFVPAGSTTLSADPAICQTPTCYDDLSKALTPNNSAWLRMEATLNPNPVTGAGPTLNLWNVSYDCKPME